MSLVAKYKFRPMNMLFTALGGLGSVCYGYNAMVISNTLAQPSFIHYMGLDQRDDANDLIGLTGSLFQLGGFIGTFFISFFADRWGRRVGLAVPAAMLVVSAAILAGSVHIGMFIAGRFLTGAGACMIVSAVTLWISEIVPPKVRGSFVNVNGASILIGGAMAAWIGYGFAQLHPGDLDSSQWRAPLAIAALPPLVLLSFLSWLPESPRWLVKEGRDEDAKQALNRLCVPEEAADEFLQIHLQLEHDRHLESSYMSILRKPSYRKRAILAMLTTISTQMTGPLVIVNYGPIIYSTLGFDTNKQLIYQAGWILTGLAGGLISLFIVDMISRPKLFAVGIIGTVTMLAIEAALVATYAPNPEALENPNTAALKAAVAMFYIYILYFEATLQGVQFVYLGEIFPMHLRAKGVGIGIAALCAINIMWLQVAPTAFANIGWKFYLCFIIPGTAMAIMILIFWPNTKQMPLEEIAALFGDEVERVEQHTQDEKALSVHEASLDYNEKVKTVN
ncbi:hypothetical protein PV10_06433 [Exophiala mesophila]|uniref:Major facilitator superfamily (MFS) profile domain-containing protein n=1 Tax=Exophiala mesophila TaxID=212818 RepID=A0A0D1XUQ5_EXOME|nr:uncharacterized protein PV10_06433 [Exophiala mesophila]KIV91946.1 hypothetical protein PV10_06433 [Exophiala mesophila]